MKYIIMMWLLQGDGLSKLVHGHFWVTRGDQTYHATEKHYLQHTRTGVCRTDNKLSTLRDSGEDWWTIVWPEAAYGGQYQRPCCNQKYCTYLKAVIKPLVPLVPLVCGCKKRPCGWFAFGEPIGYQKGDSALVDDEVEHSACEFQAYIDSYQDIKDFLPDIIIIMPWGLLNGT